MTTFLLLFKSSGSLNVLNVIKRPHFLQVFKKSHLKFCNGFFDKNRNVVMGKPNIFALKLFLEKALYV